MITCLHVFPCYKIILEMPSNQINKHSKKVKKKENAGFIRYVMLQQ